MVLLVIAVAAVPVLLGVLTLAPAIRLARTPDWAAVRHIAPARLDGSTPPSCCGHILRAQRRQVAAAPRALGRPDVDTGAAVATSIRRTSVMR